MKLIKDTRMTISQSVYGLMAESKTLTNSMPSGAYTLDPAAKFRGAPSGSWPIARQQGEGSDRQRNGNLPCAVQHQGTQHKGQHGRQLGGDAGAGLRVGSAPSRSRARPLVPVPPRNTDRVSRRAATPVVVQSAYRDRAPRAD